MNGKPGSPKAKLSGTDGVARGESQTRLGYPESRWTKTKSTVALFTTTGTTKTTGKWNRQTIIQPVVWYYKLSEATQGDAMGYEQITLSGCNDGIRVRIIEINKIKKNDEREE